MKSNPVLFIASRFFIGRKDEGGGRDQARKALAGAVLSIALSLIPLITVMQVADGMIQGISARYVELGTYHAQAWPYASSDLTGARDAARKAPGVKGAWIETQSLGIVFANGSREGAAIRGVDQGFLLDPGTSAYLRVLSGTVSLENPYDAIVGQAMAEKLNLIPGDQVNLISIRRASSGSLLPRVNIFTVRGIVSAGYRDLDAQWLFIRQDTAARILPKENTRSFIGIKSECSFNDAAFSMNSVSDRLPPGFSLYTWREIERNLFESLASTRTMLLLIMAVTVAVAAVNVSSALTTLVLERGQEIAVLKSLGATPAEIANIFSLGGTTIGGFGAVLGVAGGLLASTRINDVLSFIEKTQNWFRLMISRLSGAPAPVVQRLLDPAYYLETIPVDVPFFEMVIVVVSTVVLSFVASIGPASRAANLTPLDSFRKR